ncbi:MAG: transcriptional regulator, partial [Pseudonocardia sp.]|nr:transcriptional regulator [Pseudonocardia sp.]
MHETLTDVSASGAGEPGIAQALYELTDLATAIEDRFGNLRAWAGPGQPEPYPRSGGPEREDLLHRASVHGRPLRDRARLVSLARPRQEILGVVALIDPQRTAGDHQRFALEYGTTVLALELAHQRNLTEMELRLHRNLVDDLITGTDEHSAYARAEALGHDLHHPHYVTVVEWDRQRSDERMLDATRAVLTAHGLAAMLTRQATNLVALIAGRPNAAALYRALASELGSTRGIIGIGGRADNPSELPRSYTEAQRALEIRRTSRKPYGATA